MLVLTVDQIASRRDRDRVPDGINRVVTRAGSALLAAPERTAGDEFQAALSSAAATLDAALALVRDGDWSVGIGIGALENPEATSVRAMTGSAFVRARAAVETAKTRPERLAVDGGTDAAPLDPLVRLLVALREKRSAEGWELFDLLEASPESTVTSAAERLGISVQAASQRARTASLRLDREARDALVDLLTAADARIGG